MCCVSLEQVVLMYNRDVVCCVCLEQLVLLYIRDVVCFFMFGAGSVAAK